MAASGSAVGLGNIWGFPTNAASNGGAAFLFVYLILAFALAYPALMAELIIGRRAQANGITALRSISSGKKKSNSCLCSRFCWDNNGKLNFKFLCDCQWLDDGPFF
jgi:SNF family Na+-dependent transporter